MPETLQSSHIAQAAHNITFITALDLEGQHFL